MLTLFLIIFVRQVYTQTKIESRTQILKLIYTHDALKIESYFYFGLGIT